MIKKGNSMKTITLQIIIQLQIELKQLYSLVSAFQVTLIKML